MKITINSSQLEEFINKSNELKNDSYNVTNAYRSLYNVISSKTSVPGKLDHELKAIDKLYESSKIIFNSLNTYYSDLAEIEQDVTGVKSLLRNVGSMVNASIINDSNNVEDNNLDDETKKNDGEDLMNSLLDKLIKNQEVKSTTLSGSLLVNLKKDLGNKDKRKTIIAGIKEGKSEQEIKDLNLESKNDETIAQLWIESLNQKIKKNVAECGENKGNAVAVAAATLYSNLLDVGYTIPYDWGGTYLDNNTSVNPNWGISHNDTRGRASHSGMDCSGLYRWATYQAGLVDIDSHAERQVNRYGVAGGEKEEILQKMAKINNKGKLVPNDDTGQVGDVLFKYSTDKNPGHIKIIVGKCDKGYYVLEEARPSMRFSLMTWEEGKNYFVTHMDNLYTNSKYLRSQN